MRKYQTSLQNFFPRENEAIKHDLVEFKVQCFKVFCYHGNKSTILLFYSIFRTTPEVSGKLYFVEICYVSEKLWLFNHKRADFWLPNFGFKRSLLSLLKDLPPVHENRPLETRNSCSLLWLSVDSAGNQIGFRWTKRFMLLVTASPLLCNLHFRCITLLISA